MNISYSKKIAGALLIIFFSSGIAFADKYCNGYLEGYKGGYQEALGVSGLDTMKTPICPPRPISQYAQRERDYQDGYKQGHKEGYEKGKEEE